MPEVVGRTPTGSTRSPILLWGDSAKGSALGLCEMGGWGRDSTAKFDAHGYRLRTRQTPNRRDNLPDRRETQESKTLVG